MMDTFIRIVAIIIEVLILGVITYSILNGVKFTALDLGIKSKYNKMLTLIFLVVGVIVIMFFLAHLTTFYPDID